MTPVSRIRQLSARATNRNFRILDINKHSHLTPEAIDTAQEALLIGR